MAEVSRMYVSQHHLYPLREYAHIVSQRNTFVNDKNTTDSSVVFFTFLCNFTKTYPSPSSTALQEARTLLMMGTQVALP